MFTEHTLPATMLCLHVLPCWILPTCLIVGPRCAMWRMPPSYSWATCNPGPGITFSFSDEKMEAKKWLGPLPLTHTIGAWFRQDGKRADLTKPGLFPHCRLLPPLLQDTELTAAGSAVWSLLARRLPGPGCSLCLPYPAARLCLLKTRASCKAQLKCLKLFPGPFLLLAELTRFSLCLHSTPYLDILFF